MDDDSQVPELSADQYRALVERTSDVITIVDADGTIVFQSPNSEHVKGWTPDALVGENIFEYIHPDDRDRVREQFAPLVGETGVIEDEIDFRFRTPDDEWIWLAVTGSAPGPESTIDGYITISRDITERKEAEQSLTEQRDDLEILNEVVRHDIRNEIQLISSYTEQLKTQLEPAVEEGRVDDDLLDDLEVIAETTDTAVELTTTARALTEVMLEPDRDPEPRQLRPALEEQLEAVQARHPDATVRVEGSIADVPVLGDGLLGTVFRNLLNNAILHNDKATPEVTVSVTAEEASVVVRVADNGPGVPDNQKEQIFGKGEKGLESAGTGIGLYLVQSLVEGYGGEVWVEDNEPTGAIFVVELPVQDADSD